MLAFCRLLFGPQLILYPLTTHLPLQYQIFFSQYLPGYINMVLSGQSPILFQSGCGQHPCYCFELAWRQGSKDEGDQEGAGGKLGRIPHISAAILKERHDSVIKPQKLCSKYSRAPVWNIFTAKFFCPSSEPNLCSSVCFDSAKEKLQVMQIMAFWNLDRNKLGTL